MKAILCKPNEKPKVVDLPKRHTYLDIKALLEIESPLTCVERKIGNAYYDFWCDDEGLFQEKKYASAILMRCEQPEILCGNVLIAKHDGKGNLVGLTEEEQKNIFDGENWSCNFALMKYMVGKYGNGRDALFDGDGNMVITHDYLGFGEVLLHRDGHILKYSI